MSKVWGCVGSTHFAPERAQVTLDGHAVFDSAAHTSSIDLVVSPRAAFLRGMSCSNASSRTGSLASSTSCLASLASSSISCLCQFVRLVSPLSSYTKVMKEYAIRYNSRNSSRSRLVVFDPCPSEVSLDNHLSLVVDVRFI